jgi:hypothetical protein
MRTTIEISDQLLRAIRRRAVEEGMPMKAIVEAALRRYLQPTLPRERYKLKWRTERGVLQPGVVIEDRSLLCDFMDDAQL